MSCVQLETQAAVQCVMKESMACLENLMSRFCSREAFLRFEGSGTSGCPFCVLQMSGHFCHPVRIPRLPPLSGIPDPVASSAKLKVHRNALVWKKGVEKGAEDTGKVGGPGFVHAHTLGPREVQDVKSLELSPR